MADHEVTGDPGRAPTTPGERISYLAGPATVYDPADPRYWDEALLHAGGGPGLRDLPWLPHVLQVLRRLPQPVRAAGRQAPRRCARPLRGGARQRDGRLLPVQAVRSAVPVHAPGGPRLRPGLPPAGAPPPGRPAQAPGGQPARPGPGRPGPGRAHGPGQLRPGQHHEPGHPAPLVHGQGAGRAPPGAPAGFRQRHLRGLGRKERRAWPSGPGSRRCCSRPASCRTTSPRSARTPWRCWSTTACGAGCVRGLQCCGMPAWEHGDLDSPAPAGQGQPGRAHAARGGGLQGARHQPHLLHDAAPGISGAARGRRPGAGADAGAAVRDPGEYLWSIRNEPRAELGIPFQPRPGGLPRALPPARPVGGLQGPRPAAQDPRRHRSSRCWSAAATTAPTP